ncbi:hypothetical protein [Brevibacterium aurantiacum]|uniref:hypothetical protein n=1 Tax=Brevibacterium aurantiacum TaxID=273384 RepID=UPI003F8E6BF6
MSSEYTPTVEEVRTDYILAYDERGGSHLLAGMAFDRGIAKVKADALREAAEGVTEIDGRRDDAAATWLNDRADRIESGDGQ